MEKKNKSINLGTLLCAFMIGVTLLFSLEVHSKSDDSLILITTKTNLLPTAKSNEFLTKTVFKINPEFYKLNTVLSNNLKVNLKEPLEQDLYFFFGPYIKGRNPQEVNRNPEFNKILRELFKFHFN